MCNKRRRTNSSDANYMGALSGIKIKLMGRGKAISKLYICFRYLKA